MKSIRNLFTLLIVAALVSICSAGENEVRQKHFNLKDGVAVNGYDPVAYFVQHKAIPGKSKFAAKYKGVIYKFSSAQNLERFKKQPAKYEPQQGGWCAYAFSRGTDKVKINPKRFKIVDGKLYLFYDTIVGPNTLKLWNDGNDAKQINIAEKNWKKVVSK